LEEESLKEKEIYDSVLSLATKLLKGDQHARAAAKYSEAIEMAPRIPAARKDLMPLYNNRSAMFEKAGELEKSLLDITVVLALDNNHVKARSRRGRIFLAQGRLEEALDEFIAIMFVERSKNVPPTTIEKTDEICKKVAAQNTAVLLENIRRNKLKAGAELTPLPTKSYCRKYLESLPSIYRWREEMKGTSREVKCPSFNYL
jgi:tetratricopeptide (TPR) repeat protein